MKTVSLRRQIDRSRARRLLAQLPQPSQHWPQDFAAVLMAIEIACELAGTLSPVLERRVAPWWALRRRLRSEIVADLRSSPVTDARKKKSRSSR